MTARYRSPMILGGFEHPIVQAPMGGGPSTPALAAAVGEAGGLGFLAAGYKTPDAVRADIEALRALTDRPFGINLFAPPAATADDVGPFAARLAAEAERYGAPVGEPRHDDDGWEAKLALMAELEVPVVSFTFGCPRVSELERLGETWVTVTTPAEARQAAEAGADALVVQGAEAGGHRATFDDAAPGEIGLLALLQLVRATVDLPLVATGGIATGRGVAAVLAAGAAAAQLGTAFMLCDEAATAPAHREAIAGDGDTALTRAFTGRSARGIVNRWMREHEAEAPRAYPDVHHLTTKIRAAAREQGDPDGFHLWAGQAHTLASTGPAGELVRRLAAEAHDALHESWQRQEGAGGARSPSA
jgi:nitronate monooxygenase